MGAFEVDLMLAVVLAVNVMLFLGQVAVCDVNPSSCTRFYSVDNNLLSKYDSGNYTVSEEVVSGLPQSGGSVSPTTGNTFTDTTSTAKSWLLQIPGIDILLGVVNAVPNFLKAIGLPPAFVFAVGAFWYLLTFFLIVAWLLGK